jgi:hypothetical protein
VAPPRPDGGRHREEQRRARAHCRQLGTRATKTPAQRPTRARRPTATSPTPTIISGPPPVGQNAPHRCQQHRHHHHGQHPQPGSTASRRAPSAAAG